ncbi:MAG: hypothetical protein CMN30_33640 [Sandaracinus sp.]|nr:hypothetical protein [Sandaracinus sp.]
MLSVLALGCRSGPELPRARPEPAARLTEPSVLCLEQQPRGPCLPAARVEGWLEDPALTIVGVHEAPAGEQGAKVFTLQVPSEAGPIVFRAKWRTGGYNGTRRELGAHVVQTMFLEPHEYVVPPASGHCFELAHYRRWVDPEAEPTFPGIRCVHGVLQYWLENAQTLPEAEEAGWFNWSEGALFDAALWERDRTYRDSLAHVNLLSHLIDHADTHWAQFLIVADPATPRVYGVDNSLSFGARQNPGLRLHDWSRIKVPALPGATIERLRSLGDRLDRLSVLEQFARRDDGVLVEEEARPPAAPGDRGYYFVEGKLKARLEQAEIDGLRARLEALLARVDGGEIELYR